jgi:hypothetical protein
LINIQNGVAMDKKLALYDTAGNKTFTTINTSASSAQTAAIQADRILIVSAAAHFVEFGSNPTAGTDGFIIPPNTPMQFVFTKGHKVAARTHSGNGHLTVLSIL